MGGGGRVCFIHDSAQYLEEHLTPGGPSLDSDGMGERMFMTRLRHTGWSLEHRGWPAFRNRAALKSLPNKTSMPFA